MGMGKSSSHMRALSFQSMVMLNPHCMFPECIWSSASRQSSRTGRNTEGSQLTSANISSGLHKVQKVWDWWSRNCASNAKNTIIRERCTIYNQAAKLSRVLRKLTKILEKGKKSYQGNKPVLKRFREGIKPINPFKTTSELQAGLYKKPFLKNQTRALETFW